MGTRRRIDRGERVYAVEGVRILYKGEREEAYRGREEIKERNKEKKEERVKIECWGRELWVDRQLYREWLAAVK